MSALKPRSRRQVACGLDLVEVLDVPTDVFGRPPGGTPYEVWVPDRIPVFAALRASTHWSVEALPFELVDLVLAQHGTGVSPAACRAMLQAVCVPAGRTVGASADQAVRYWLRRAAEQANHLGAVKRLCQVLFTAAANHQIAGG